MAKLNSYYTLCPLIDQQNLLGVEKDSDPLCAIVTLGRNIVIRYKLQDLKQISSWTSKERLTTQVIYDKSMHQYAAVFNEKKIRVWSGKETDLNNVKKYKFLHPFHTILTSDDFPSVVIQQNGATASLEWALKNRRTWSNNGILQPTEKLLKCQLVCLNNKIGLCCLTRIEKVYNCIVAELKDQTCLIDENHVRRIELNRLSEDLVGHVVMQRKNSAYLLTLWSHGRLYSHLLSEEASALSSGTLVSIITNINPRHPVVMTSLNETTIAVYGADVSEEGAVLMIYNVQFKLVQATQKLKLYTKDAKLWKVEDKLLLAANRHLAIAPYQLAPQRIATMLGSSINCKINKDDSNEDDIMIIEESTVAKWEENRRTSAKLLTHGIPRSISKQVHSYINKGSSDAEIQKALIPQLIESKDISGIFWCLDTFADLPEKLLIDLLAFTLRTPEETFGSVQNGTSERKPEKANLHSRHHFLDKIFRTNYSYISLLSYLKVGLKIDEVLQLLSYLMEKLCTKEDSIDCSAQPSDKQLYDWFSLLLDSHYQHYILSQDADILTFFNNLIEVLDDHFQLLKEMQNLQPMLTRAINGKSLKPSRKDFDKFYSIEEVKLY